MSMSPQWERRNKFKQDVGSIELQSTKGVMQISNCRIKSKILI